MPGTAEANSGAGTLRSVGRLGTRPGVVVLGMHRSGTSAVTQALVHLGLDPGPDLLGGDWSNPNGHWESLQLLAANEALLGSAGATWQTLPKPFVLPTGRDAVDHARSTFATWNAATPWVWKDPRLCLLLPFWRQVFAPGPDPAAVLCLRNPLEIAASLERRNGLSRPDGLELWQTYLESALAALDGLPVLVTNYEEFVADEASWAERATRFLVANGVAVGDQAASSAVSAAREDLRHHRFFRDDVTDSPMISSVQRDLYQRTLGLTDTDAFRVGDEVPAVVPKIEMRTQPHREIWVAGFPSTYGGADTELDHLIDLFRIFDVQVNLVPLFGVGQTMRDSALARGCRIHEFHPGIFAGHVVTSFCNGEFLRLLPEIVAAGRPRTVVWFNCMTWTFDAELRAHTEGWIDVFGFESAYQRDCLGPRLEEIAPYRTFGYRPYFHAARVDWNHREFAGTYRVGRISRDDPAKYAPDTWSIFDRVLVPVHLRKKVFLLGYGPHAAGKIGSPPPGLDWLTWSPDAVPSAEFYRNVDTLMHKTGGSRESYGRVVVEAYAHGVVPIVEDGFAFGDLVVHGETGFRAKTSDEMSHYASVLAFDEKLHEGMARAGREWLERNSDPQACFEPWLELL